MRTTKDAPDLYRLIVDYADAGNLDRIYDEELPLLEAAGYDLELAGAQLLGRDVARICQPETRHQISAVLSSNRLIDQLIQQMNRTGFDEEVQAEPAISQGGVWWRDNRKGAMEFRAGGPVRGLAKAVFAGGSWVAALPAG